MPPRAKEARTCDNCRKRKIKCMEDPLAPPLPGQSQSGPSSYGDGGGSVASVSSEHTVSGRASSVERITPDRPCEGCRKLRIDCTFDYVKKKPGRKNGFVLKMRSEKSGQSSYHPYAFETPSSLINPATRPLSSFAFAPAARRDDDGNGTNDLSWLDAILEGTAGGAFGGQSTVEDLPYSGLGDGSWIPNQFISDQAHLLALESPENMATSSTNGSGGAVPGGGGQNNLGRLVHGHQRREPQLEDVTSWANISYFISLFLQYLYPLLPLVHRPTFSEHLATRRDLRDSDFRALLLSIVAYVISQLPTSRLVNDTFDIESLKRLQRRCHRTCKALQRTYYGPTNLTQITTIIFDTFYLLSIGLGHTSGSRLGQAVQLAFSMGMNSDEKTLDPELGLDHIEIQLRRRVFWQLYASDKTRAIPGLPMLINEFQGVCSLPEPTDDEHITSQGMFQQPSQRPSVLSGFVTVSRVFRVLSEAFFHHRCITSGLKTIGTQWTVEAEERLNEILREMPLVIQNPLYCMDMPLRAVFGMQRANIWITAAIAKFALYDLRAALNVDKEQLDREREAIAREIHSLLMNIPLEDLASNGESVRGKIFHIFCALCTQTQASDSDQELIKDWVTMFSTISFVQMPPPPPDAAADSQAPTPSANVELP